ncbi:hypothetical protein DMUE_2510 [Dictyocoela muelleri]|nr:hypothetical protein DMUE_2510 [Dictyocoela muelleri]
MCKGCLGSVQVYDKEQNRVKCRSVKCRKKQVLITKASFFGSLLSISKTLKVIFHIFIGDKCGRIKALYGINKNSVRRILLELGKFLEFYNSSNKIGGPGIVVEIDESKFGKRKYNRSHLVTGSWILGGVERSSERRIFRES